jgi:hypothetical protein
MTLRRFALAPALVLLAFAAPAQAAVLPDQTLKTPDQVIHWQGKTTDPTGQGYGPPTQHTCSDDTCDSFVLKIDVPEGTFPKAAKNPAPDGVTRMQAEGPTDMPGDGVLISVKWPTDFDQWNLYVEDTSTGQTVAQGFDLDSNAQSVLLPQPHNGTYKVWVVPFYTDFDKVDQDYKGEARVWLDPSQRHPAKTKLLPSIETMPPANFHIGDVPAIPSNPMGWRYTSPGTFSNSCYTDETVQFGSQRCLRFDNDIRNTGDGPLIMRFAWSPDSVTNNCSMQQEILASDATVSDRDAGPCNFHPQHAHFHYQNMGIYELYPVGGDGLPAAKAVATSRKVGFCTIDVDYYTFGAAQPGGPRTYSFPTCNMPNAFASKSDGPYGPTSPPEYMGISAGWGDVYTWDLPQQYIDITNNVPDGTYEVVSRSNPDGGILTSDRNAETGVTCVAIKGAEVKTVREFKPQATYAPLPRCGDEPAKAKPKSKAHHKKKHKPKKTTKKKKKGHHR